MGWTDEGGVGGAGSENAAHIEKVDCVAGFYGFGDMPGITLEGISMSKGPGEDIALFEGAHSTGREFQGVICGLAGEESDGNNIAFVTGVFVVNADIASEGGVLGDAGDFIEDEGSQLVSPWLARAWRIPARP